MEVIDYSPIELSSGPDLRQGRFASHCCKMTFGWEMQCGFFHMAQLSQSRGIKIPAPQVQWLL